MLKFFGIGGSIFTFGWIACPDWTASYSVPDANICILLVVLDRKHSEVSKTVSKTDVCEYNRTHIAGKNIQTGSGKSEVCSFWTQPLSNSQWDMGYFALPKASTRCQPSLEHCFRLLLWRGARWQLFDSGVCQQPRSQSRAFHTRGISRSIAFLQAMEFSGWNIIEHLW
jgi:hypothetical protein